jgi:hypothetical protein
MMHPLKKNRYVILFILSLSLHERQLYLIIFNKEERMKKAGSYGGKTITVVCSVLVFSLVFLSCAGPDTTPDDNPEDAMWVAVGADQGDGSGIYYSYDGTTWSSATAAASEVIQGIATDGNGNWVTAGYSGEVFFSKDGGNTWEAGSLGEATNLLSITTDGNGYWLAVGFNGSNYHSIDTGENWEAGGSTGVTEHLQDVASDGEGTWVAVGNDDVTSGVIFWSEDGGQTWHRATNPLTGNVNSVATDGAGNWVAVGADGIVLYTADVTEWTAGTNTSNNLSAVATDRNGTWAAVGSGGDIRYSKSNGENWLPASSGTSTTLTGVDCDAKGNWIACGDTGTAGIVLYSSDGMSWENETATDAYFFMDIACND